MAGAGRFMLVAVTAALAASLACPALAVASPDAPSSAELVEEPSRFDGETIVFEGEAVGEAMVRGSNAWVHLNDDAYMLRNVEEGAPLGGLNSGMPVWVSASDAELIGVFGDYKHQGDIVRIEGVFNAACPEHGGDMDIHATTVEVSAEGRRAVDPIKPWKPVAALVLTGLAGGLWLAEKRARRLEMRGLWVARSVSEWFAEWWGLG